MVGQCEISHPVRPSGVNITVNGAGTKEDFDTHSFYDDFDETVGKPRNVLFEASNKDEYEPLDARIWRKYNALHGRIFILIAMDVRRRAFLYQRVWKRDTSVAESGLHI